MGRTAFVARLRRRKWWIIYFSLVLGLPAFAVWWRCHADSEGGGSTFPSSVEVGTSFTLRPTTPVQAIWVYRKWQMKDGGDLDVLTQTCPTSDTGLQVKVTRKTLVGELTVTDSEWNCDVQGEGDHPKITVSFPEEGQYFLVFILPGGDRPQPGLGLDRDLEELRKWGLAVKVLKTEAVATAP